MAQPVLLAVDSERDILTALQRDLTRRFASDYRIVTADAPDVALAALDANDQVAVVIAGQWLTETTGVDFLSACHQLYPAASGCCSSATVTALAAPPRYARSRSDSLIKFSTSRGGIRNSSCTLRFRCCSVSDTALW